MPRLKANRLPNMLAFDGVDDFLTLPIVPAVTGFNLAFFAISRTFVTNARIFDNQNSGPVKGFTVLQDALGFIASKTGNDASGSVGICNGKFTPNGRMSHYAITYDGTNLKHYENGVLIATDTSATMTLPSATVLTVAKRTGSANFWNGKLGEVVFQNTATPWTQAQITELYYSGSIPSGASYWLFNGDVLDGSGNGNHGTLTGGTYVNRDSTRTVATRSVASSRMPVSILPQKSLYFGSDTSAVVAIPDSVDIRPETTKKFTWSFWVNLYSISNNVLPRFIEKGSTYACFMGDMTNGRRRNVALEMANSVGGTATEYWGNTKLSLNRWYHIVMTFDDVTAQHYVNGVAETMTTIGGPYVSPMTSESGVAMKIGNRASGSRNPMGMIADFKVWNRALSALEAEDVFNGKAVTDGLVGAWKLDEGSGTTVVDSVSGNNGTVISATWRNHPTPRTSV